MGDFWLQLLQAVKTLFVIRKLWLEIRQSRKKNSDPGNEEGLQSKD